MIITLEWKWNVRVTWNEILRGAVRYRFMPHVREDLVLRWTERDLTYYWLITTHFVIDTGHIIYIFIPKPHLRVAKIRYSEVPASIIFCYILQEDCRFIMCLYMSPCVSDCNRAVRRIRPHPSRSFPIHAVIFRSVQIPGVLCVGE